MKCLLTQEYGVKVFDINTPMKKTSIRHDFRLICKISRDEHDSNIVEAGISICSKMGLTERRWKMLLREGEKQHRLWRGNRLTKLGLKCAEDGFILENEDGVHRLWVIDAPKPVGLRVLHCEAWEDIKIEKGSKSPKEKKIDILSRLDKNIPHESVVNEDLKILYDPPPWYTKFMKSTPIVMANDHHSSSVKLSATYETGMRNIRYTLSGKILGIDMKDHVGSSSKNIDSSKTGEIHFTNVEIDIKDGINNEALIKELGILLEPHLAEGQSWSPNSQSVITTHAGLKLEESQSMKTSFSIKNLSNSVLNEWNTCELEEVLLIPSNVNEARKWVAELYWSDERGYLPSDTVDEIISEISSQPNFASFTFKKLVSVPPSEWLPYSENAPSGSSWFFRALNEHSWMMELMK